MKLKHLIEEFERSEALAAESWSNAQVVEIIRNLRKLTMQYVGHTKLPQLQRRSPQGPVEVNSDTRWG